MQHKARTVLHHLAPVGIGIIWVLVIMTLGARTGWVQSEASYFSMLIAMAPAPLVVVYTFLKSTRAYWYRAVVLGLLLILVTPSTLPLVAMSGLSWALWRAWNRDRTVKENAGVS